jgi:hypothetical protein
MVAESDSNISVALHSAVELVESRETPLEVSAKMQEDRKIRMCSMVSETSFYCFYGR